MRTQLFPTSEFQAAQPDPYIHHFHSDDSVSTQAYAHAVAPLYAGAEQTPPSANHIHIVINNGLVHVYGENNSADQQAAVVRAVYDLIGITDCVPVPTTTPASPTEICATIEEALQHVPGLAVQQVHVEMQDGAVVLHGITPDR